MFATLHFLEDKELYISEKPYELWVPLSSDVPRTNCVYEAHQVQLLDVRTSVSKPKTEGAGFQFVDQPSQFASLIENNESVVSSIAVEKYLEETAKLLEQHFQAHLVVVDDWRVSCCLFLLEVI